jgi:hypothetical protein
LLISRPTTVSNACGSEVLSGARDEFHLATIVQNLKTMALRLLGPPTGQQQVLDRRLERSPDMGYSVVVV